MTTPVDALDERALPAIAALCRRGLRDAPIEDELAGALFAPDQPARVRGDPDIGIVASTTWGENGFVRLLVVDPDHRQINAQRVDEVDVHPAVIVVIEHGDAAAHRFDEILLFR